MKANKKYAAYYSIQEEDYIIRFLISLQPYLWSSEKKKLAKGEVLVDVEKGGRHWKEVITIKQESAPSFTACVYEKSKEEQENQGTDYLSCVRSYTSTEDGKTGVIDPPTQKQMVNEAVERLKILNMPQAVIEFMENNGQPCWYFENCFITSKCFQFGSRDNMLPYFGIIKDGDVYEFYLATNPDGWTIEKEALRGGSVTTFVFKQGHYEMHLFQVEELGICMDAPLYDADSE